MVEKMKVASSEEIRESLEFCDLNSCKKSYGRAVETLVTSYLQGSIHGQAMDAVEREIQFQRGLKSLHLAWVRLCKAMPDMFEQIAKEVETEEGKGTEHEG